MPPPPSLTRPSCAIEPATSISPRPYRIPPLSPSCALSTPRSLLRLAAILSPDTPPRPSGRLGFRTNCGRPFSVGSTTRRHCENTRFAPPSRQQTSASALAELVCRLSPLPAPPSPCPRRSTPLQTTRTPMSSRRLAATTTATIQPSCELPANRRIITILTAHSTDLFATLLLSVKLGVPHPGLRRSRGYNPNLAFVDLAGQTTLFHDPFHSGPPTTVPGTNHLVQVNPARETGLHEITLLTFDPTTRRLQRTEPNPFAEVNLIELFPSAGPKRRLPHRA
ncbi:hypothetical protein DFJ73DRAFT_381909 [Zopfochytrium polystomum]|nr:hypothetical protein DFJ73DRAFT_381909 [Zopfochytrium polystomum]